MPDNQIVVENARTDGRMPKSYWDVPHSSLIEGFATDFSVDNGNRIDFKINVSDTPGSDYQVEIFRLGHYDGDGARMVAGWTNSAATVQPDATFNPVTGTADAGNWAVTDSWNIPADAVSGVYLARVQRLDANGNPVNGAVNQIPFVVRDDDRPADIVLQTSDTTWQAYNGWIGNNGQVGANFYGDSSGTVDHPVIPGSGDFAQDRAYALSYNRPLVTRGIDGQQGGPAAGAQDYLFGADYAGIAWLEQNGYDVAYMSGVDTDRLGADYLKKYGAFISVGHDEYWSADQRYNVEEARDAGVNLLFWSGNEVYWKTRWETSTVDGQEYRTLVCYKETWAHIDPAALPADYFNLDPENIWTGTWRDDRFLGNPLAGDATDRPALSGQPDLYKTNENALTGQIFGPDGTGEFGGALDVPAEYAALRFWRDTSISATGGVDLAAGILGYEWDTSPLDAYRPDGLVHLSETTIPWNGILVDDGNTVEPGIATHNLSVYRADSGALVFGAGTVFWTWALSNLHDGQPYDAQIENADLQQFVVNLFADMGIQPGQTDAVLAGQGLSRAAASSDVTPAVATLDTLPDTLPVGSPVLLTGTTTDNDGNPLTDDGAVVLVEVSFDNGGTWSVAEGTTNWSYAWSPDALQSYQIRVRAIDDSLNLPTTASLATEVVQVTAPETVSLFEPWVQFDGGAYSNPRPLQLGTTFSVSTTGQITELHYYRAVSDATDTDTRTGRLWRDDGTLLATTSFVSAPNESGWQTATLLTPVNVMTGQNYIVSYETANNYVSSLGFFNQSYSDPFGYLSATTPSSGVYAEAAGAVIPTSSYQSSNYWVDVTFDPGEISYVPPEFTSPAAVSIAENSVLVATLTAQTTEPVTYGIQGGADASAFNIDPATGKLNFVFAPDFEVPSDSNTDNIFEVTVSASDSLSPPVTQNLQVTVTDVVDESGATVSNLFAPTALPAATETGDATDYELGTRFTASKSGEVASLRYWRGVPDADDTDIRTLNLWDSTGALLASETVTSGAGQSGWQVGVLSSAVQVTANATYTVSYGTTQNYAFSSNYFGTPQTGPDGILTASQGAGVYAAGTPGVLPTQSYQNSNYWVDVGFRASDAPNQPPAFTLAGTSFTVPENRTTAATITAIDPDGDNFVFAVAGGNDAAAFNINGTSGLLSFAATPDFEAPQDLNLDNIYEVLLSISDGINPAVTQAITVEVTDVVDETAPVLASLFGVTDAPAQIITSDSTDYELGVEFAAATNGEVTALRYWRGDLDAGDTDTRTLNLWTGTGTLLASASVTSTPSQSGWQTATLATPVALTANDPYVASYGTTQNYAFSGNFFATDWVGADGTLTAPASVGPTGNGVFSAGTTGLFPESSYNASNYWVDLYFDPFDALI